MTQDITRRALIILIPAGVAISGLLATLALIYG